MVKLRPPNNFNHHRNSITTKRWKTYNVYQWRTYNGKYGNYGRRFVSLLVLWLSRCILFVANDIRTRTISTVPRVAIKRIHPDAIVSRDMQRHPSSPLHSSSFSRALCGLWCFVSQRAFFGGGWGLGAYQGRISFGQTLLEWAGNPYKTTLTVPKTKPFSREKYD